VAKAVLPESVAQLSLSHAAIFFRTDCQLIHLLKLSQQNQFYVSSICCSYTKYLNRFNILHIPSAAATLPGRCCFYSTEAIIPKRVTRFFVSGFFHQTTFPGLIGQAQKRFRIFRLFVDSFVIVIDSPVMNTPGSRLESLGLGNFANINHMSLGC
jgi:hypothetical protein